MRSSPQIPAEYVLVTESTNAADYSLPLTEYFTAASVIVYAVIVDERQAS